MKRTFRAVIALILAAAVFSGCGLSDYVHARMNEVPVTPYSDMVYTRPDEAQLAATLEESCRVAREETDIDAVYDAIFAFYDEYDKFFTALALADIAFSRNTASEKWAEEYDFCLSVSSQAEAGLDELYRALAQSPIREALEEEYFGEGYFTAYEGESVMDQGYLDLMEREAEILSRYYDLNTEFDHLEYGSDAFYEAAFEDYLAVYVELIALRQELAAYCGYDSFPEFAYDFYFYRDYTPEESRAYLENLRQALYEPYCAVNRSDIWDRVGGYCGEKDTFAYLQKTAEAMGGVFAEGFDVLERGGLYDIGTAPNKYETSFEIYLWSYYEPYIFVCPSLTQADKLTFVHEFGHFLNDYICYGSYAGTDVAEVQSQAMEYLSLCYSDADEVLTEYKLADSLCTYMESGAWALFEMEVYGLEGDDLTAENVAALYEEICLSFGFDSWQDWDSRDIITIDHIFTQPMYLVSYVVSNDLAVQLYQKELASPGQGLALYEDILTSEDSYIIEFAETHGLTSPFAPGRIKELGVLFG